MTSQGNSDRGSRELQFRIFPQPEAIAAIDVTVLPFGDTAGA
jgi:hypothetical protein